MNFKGDENINNQEGNQGLQKSLQQEGNEKLQELSLKIRSIFLSLENEKGSEELRQMRKEAEKLEQQKEKEKERQQEFYQEKTKEQVKKNVANFCRETLNMQEFFEKLRKSEEIQKDKTSPNKGEIMNEKFSDLKEEDAKRMFKESNNFFSTQEKDPYLEKIRSEMEKESNKSFLEFSEYQEKNTYLEKIRSEMGKELDKDFQNLSEEQRKKTYWKEAQWEKIESNKFLEDQAGKLHDEKAELDRKKRYDEFYRKLLQNQIEERNLRDKFSSLKEKEREKIEKSQQLEIPNIKEQEDEEVKEDFYIQKEDDFLYHRTQKDKMGKEMFIESFMRSQNNFSQNQMQNTYWEVKSDIEKRIVESYPQKLLENQIFELHKNKQYMKKSSDEIHDEIQKKNSINNLEKPEGRGEKPYEKFPYEKFFSRLEKEKEQGKIEGPIKVTIPKMQVPEDEEVKNDREQEKQLPKKLEAKELRELCREKISFLFLDDFSKFKKLLQYSSIITERIKKKEEEIEEALVKNRRNTGKKICKKCFQLNKKKEQEDVKNRIKNTRKEICQDCFREIKKINEEQEDVKKFLSPDAKHHPFNFFMIFKASEIGLSVIPEGYRNFFNNCDFIINDKEILSKIFEQLGLKEWFSSGKIDPFSFLEKDNIFKIFLIITERKFFWEKEYIFNIGPLVNEPFNNPNEQEKKKYTEKEYKESFLKFSKEKEPIFWIILFLFVTILEKNPSLILEYFCDDQRFVLNDFFKQNLRTYNSDLFNFFDFKFK